MNRENAGGTWLSNHVTVALPPQEPLLIWAYFPTHSIYRQAHSTFSILPLAQYSFQGFLLGFYWNRNLDRDGGMGYPQTVEPEEC